MPNPYIVDDYGLRPFSFFFNLSSHSRIVWRRMCATNGSKLTVEHTDIHKSKGLYMIFVNPPDLVLGNMFAYFMVGWAVV